MDLKILAVAIIFLFLFKKGKQSDNIIDWEKSGTFLKIKFKDGSEYLIQQV